MIVVLVLPPLLAEGLTIASKLLAKPARIEQATAPLGVADEGSREWLSAYSAKLTLEIERLNKELSELPASSAHAPNPPKD